MDFAHPPTTELFDRTEQQRAERTEIIVQLYRDGADPSTVEEGANKAMFDCFLGDIALAIRDKKTEKIKATLLTTPAIDRDAVGLSAEAEVLSEINELHEALPFPNLERSTGISPEYTEHAYILKGGLGIVT